VAGGNGRADQGREPPAAGPGERLWRARRRHHYIDALVRDSDTGSVLEFRRNGRSLVTWRFDTRAVASAEAMTRLRDLQRAGWNTHW
jgi:hypothetical protein